MRCIDITKDQYLSVYQFNKAMESHFKSRPEFRNVYVKGEVSNKFISASNHLYFTLKDKSSQVPCIVYSWFRKNIKFDIEDGMKLLVTANVTVYPPHGKYQLDVRSAVEDGLGQLYVKYQQLKKKLDSEGLFDENHKKDLPRFPKSIGVITSRGGSVIHDILKTVKNNWPYCQVILFPAAVQGANSKRELITQIRRADSSNMDVLIVARGGGSIEDLWSYNEEELVRTIFACETPVISAVGHESDMTLTDLVADKRASTPTMAATMAVEDKASIMESISHYHSRLIAFISSKMDKYKKELHLMHTQSLFTDSTYVYKSRKANFDELQFRFKSVSGDVINSNRMALEKLTSQYVIKHPCKMQLDTSRSNLNELQTRLFTSMENILKTNRSNLDKASDNFNFLSKNMLMSKQHDLEMVKSGFTPNLFNKRVDESRNGLGLIYERMINQVNGLVEDNQRELRQVSDDFENASRKLILDNSYMLDSIKNHTAIRNPQRIYESRNNELNHVKDNKIIRNPYLMLGRYRNELKIYEEKLDKINNMIILKKEQKRQRQTYITVIAAIVIVMIIVLILMLGGIL